MLRRAVIMASLWAGGCTATRDGEVAGRIFDGGDIGDVGAQATDVTNAGDTAGPSATADGRNGSDDVAVGDGDVTDHAAAGDGGYEGSLADADASNLAETADGDAPLPCAPAATRCSGTIPQTCDSSGAWQSAPVTKGQCGASCTPGEGVCWGTSTVLTCDAMGSQWPSIPCVQPTPSCELGACVCPSNYHLSNGICCPAGETGCAGVRVDEQTDSANCGGCGILCGGKCSAGGRCQITLAASVRQHSTDGLAIDATSAYWTDHLSGTIMKVPLNGGTAIQLASAQSMPLNIAVDATSVCWSSAGNIMKAPLGGGTATALSGQGGQGLGTLAVDATSVYFTSGTAVMKVPVSGGTTTQLASGQQLGGIAVDATSVYWTDYGSGAVIKVLLGGGTVVRLASGQAFHGASP